MVVGIAGCGVKVGNALERPLVDDALALGAEERHASSADEFLPVASHLLHHAEAARPTAKPHREVVLLAGIVVEAGVVVGHAISLASRRVGRSAELTAPDPLGGHHCPGRRDA
jgi:hypothetical protein